MSAESVLRLLHALHYNPQDPQRTVIERGVDGHSLSYVESLEDLHELQFGLPAIKERSLMGRIAEFRVQGVPIELLQADVHLQSPDGVSGSTTRLKICFCVLGHCNAI